MSETVNRIYEYNSPNDDPEWVVLMSFCERWRAAHGWPTQVDLSDVVNFAKHLLANIEDFQKEMAEFKVTWEEWKKIPRPRPQL